MTVAGPALWADWPTASAGAPSASTATTAPTADNVIFLTRPSLGGRGHPLRAERVVAALCRPFRRRRGRGRRRKRRDCGARAGLGQIGQTSTGPDAVSAPGPGPSPWWLLSSRSALWDA